MPRYFQHTRTDLPSLHVGLPVEFMHQKIQGKQKQKDILDFEVENMGLANIQAIEDAEADVSVRNYYNKTIIDQNEKATELMSNIDRNNPDRTLNEVARLVTKNKKLIRDVDTPGTEAYVVNQNYLQYQKFLKDVREDKIYGTTAKRGITSQRHREYIEAGGFKGFPPSSPPGPGRSR